MEENKSNIDTKWGEIPEKVKKKYCKERHKLHEDIMKEMALISAQCDVNMVYGTQDNQAYLERLQAAIAENQEKSTKLIAKYFDKYYK